MTRIFPLSKATRNKIKMQDIKEEIIEKINYYISKASEESDIQYGIKLTFKISEQIAQEIVKVYNDEGYDAIYKKCDLFIDLFISW